MLFASIDIGSNAVRLLFSNVYVTDNQLPTAAKATLVRIPLRLGEDVFKTGKISEERIQKLIKTLEAFKLLIDVYNPLGFEACATAAMREAVNNVEIIERIKTEAGLDVRIIDGFEEAEIIRSSNNIDLNADYKTSMYIDVGGGSTEISILKNHKFVTCNSFNIGTVRLLNKKVEDESWEDMKNWLAEFKIDVGRINCIGTGGNINRLTKLFGDQIENTLTYTQLQFAYKQLKSIPLKERIEKMGLRPDRADVIVPAAKIFLTILKAAGIESLIAPKVGLADGLIYRLHKKYVKENKS
ncbi:MAG: exopolyphosphatase [Bacteroidetes bacterium]|nr:exopolyphosphatase [Bacteroidota bacterium]